MPLNFPSIGQVTVEKSMMSCQKVVLPDVTFQLSYHESDPGWSFVDLTNVTSQNSFQSSTNPRDFAVASSSTLMWYIERTKMVAIPCMIDFHNQLIKFVNLIKPFRSLREGFPKRIVF